MSTQHATDSELTQLLGKLSARFGPDDDGLRIVAILAERVRALEAVTRHGTWFDSCGDWECRCEFFRMPASHAYCERCRTLRPLPKGSP